jgi:hypothetical protein
MAWISVLVSRHFWRIMKAATEVSPQIARLSYGLVSFIVANAAAFSVATQAFGDVFILLILGWVVGFLFAIPVLVQEKTGTAEHLAAGPFGAGRLRPAILNPARVA